MFLKESYFKEKFNWFMLGKKKPLNLKPSYFRYFKEKNH